MKPPNKILLLHIKKLKGYISLVTFETKEEIIHELRVEFKKTRALLRLADGDNNKLKVPKVLKEFYTAAGRVRELQLQQQLIKDCCGEDNLPAYFKILSAQLLFATSVLKEKAREEGLDKSLLLIKKNFPYKITAKTVKTFISQKAKDLLTALAIKNKKDDDIHGARKIIKDLMYTFNNLRILQMQSVIHLSAEDEKKIHTLGAELGIFQDQCNALALLRLSMFRNLPANEKEILKATRAGWMATKIELRKTIIQKLIAAKPIFEVLSAKQ